MVIKRPISDFIGYAAMVLILGTYALFTAGFIGKPLYVGTGMLTSVMMAFHAWERKSKPVLFMNAVWFTLSAVGLWRG